MAFLPYILQREELHALGHLVGKAKQVIKGQRLQVLSLIIDAVIHFWTCKMN